MNGMKAKNSKIKNRAKARQLIDFTGLEIGKCCATDLDCLIEYQNTLFIFIECKHVDNIIPTGQELAFRRLVDNLEIVGKYAYFIKVEHSIPAHQDIILAKQKPTQIYYKGIWHDIIKSKTVLHLRDRLIKIAGINFESF